LGNFNGSLLFLFFWFAVFCAVLKN
jgi:hypothetical protein